MRTLKIISATLILTSCSISPSPPVEMSTNTVAYSNKESSEDNVVKDDDAMRLVHAAHLDEMSLVVFQTAYETGFKEGTVSSEQLACIRAVDPKLFSDPFVAPLHAQLSHDEIMTALAFLESPAGKKYVALHLIEVYKALGAKPIVQKPTYSEQDRKDINYFFSTATGAKLIGPNSVFHDAALKDATRPLSLALGRKCSQ